MPTRSGRQYRAAQAAAHGRSKVGMPRKVARELIEATPKQKRAVYAKKRKRRPMKYHA